MLLAASVGCQTPLLFSTIARGRDIYLVLGQIQDCNAVVGLHVGLRADVGD
jgi:hypothetical protein